MNQEKKDKWHKIIEDMWTHWSPYLGSSSNNHLASLNRGLSIPAFTDEELQYITEQVKEAIDKEVNTLKDIRAVITMIGKDTRTVSKHSQSTKEVKERNLKSTMVKKALENYVPREGDELVVVYRQEEDAS